MDTSSAKRLEKVHPALAAKITAVIAELAAEGRDVRVVQGLRTYAEQDGLYAQGRTKPGKKVTNARGGYSNHNFGLAVDMCPFNGGKPDWNDTTGFKAIGRAGKRQGLEWGGDWTRLVDMPHLQLPGPSVAECRKAFASGGLSAVWAMVKDSAAAPTLPSDSVETAKPEPTPSVPPPMPELKRGAKGEAVRRLQLALRANGFDIEADADFGPATERAVKGFQTEKGLRPDGIAGSQTYRALGI